MIEATQTEVDYARRILSRLTCKDHSLRKHTLKKVTKWSDTKIKEIVDFLQLHDDAANAREGNGADALAKDFQVLSNLYTELGGHISNIGTWFGSEINAVELVKELEADLPENPSIAQVLSSLSKNYLVFTKYKERPTENQEAN